MPAIDFICPECGHVTHWHGSIEAMRQLPPQTCACGATKKRKWEPIALSPGRRTEGKGTAK